VLHSVVSELLSNILALNFADKVGGIVYPMQKEIINSEGGTVVKTFPVYGNDPTVCESGDYIEMLPDSDLKSVIYFESTPESVVSCGNPVTSNSTLTCVCWFNLAKINKNLRTGEGLLHLVANSINGSWNITIGTTVVHTVLTLINIDFRNPQYFAKWSINEANKQFLIYPRDFGAVQFDVQLNYGICEDEPIIDPLC